MHTVIKHFRVPIVAAILGIGGTLALGGVEAAYLVAILAVLEVSLSFDNAVVNAKYLNRLPPWWQQLFLTLGVIIAVFFMRFLFPILIVAVTAHLNPIEVLRIAINHPNEYKAHLDQAHPGIAALGSTFLMMIFLGFLMDDEKEVDWLPVEKPFKRLAGLVPAAVITAGGLLLVAQLSAGPDARQVLVFGLVGIALNLGVSALNDYYEGQHEDDPEDLAHAKVATRTGTAALATFMFLEVLDASFSFDGVTGAFAISQNIFIIAIGLGIGATVIRSATVWLVEKGTLTEFVYLEHGAHWAIGSLAVLLAVTIRHDVPEWITGLVGVLFILSAVGSSIVVKRRESDAATSEEDPQLDDLSPAAR